MDFAFESVERSPGSSQQPLTPQQVAAVTRRAFGEHVGIRAAVELGDGAYNTTYLLSLEPGTNADEDVILRVAPEPARQFRSERRFMRNEHAAAPYFAPLAPLLPRTLAVDFTHELIGRDYMIQSVVPGVPARIGLENYPRAAWSSFFRDLGTISRRLHEVRGEGFGAPAGPLYSTWSEALAAHLTDMAADLDASGLESADVRVLAETAVRRRDLLDEITEPRLLHGDLWTINVMTVPDAPEPKVSGVFDCDRAVWGDPESDWAVYRALDRPGTERDGFWDGYGPLRTGAAAHWRRVFYAARYLGTVLVERHRLAEPDKVAEGYDALRAVMDRLKDAEPG